MKGLSMKIGAFFLSMMLFMLLGCATIPKEADLKESLKTAADRYWKLRMEDRYEDTYKMEDSQGLPPFEEYRNLVMRKKGVQIRSVAVQNVTVNGDSGEVDTEWIYALPKISQPFHDVIKDRWTFRDGTWWHTLLPKSLK